MVYSDSLMQFPFFHRKKKKEKMLDKNNPSGAFVDASATLLTIRDFKKLDSNHSKRSSHSASEITLGKSVQIDFASATGAFRVLNK